MSIPNFLNQIKNFNKYPYMKKRNSSTVDNNCQATIQFYFALLFLMSGGNCCGSPTKINTLEEWRAAMTDDCTT